MDISLDRLCSGVWATVVCVDTSTQLRQRLRNFGLVPGTKVRCRYSSPGGDVAAIELRGSVLALRKKDLQCIRVLV